MIPLLLAALLAQPPAPSTLPPLLTPAAPTIPPAQIDDALEIGGEAVAARSVRSRLSVPVRINGQGPFRFVVDSGADRSVIGEGVAARLQLPSARPLTLHGIAGTARVPAVEIDTLQLGSSIIERLTVPALREGDLGAQGLIGIDALADQRLLMDYDRREIRVEDSRKPIVARADEIVVVARRRNGQLILTQVTVRGRAIFAVIDTGSEVTIGNLALAARLFGRRSGPPRRPVTLIGVTGATAVADMALLDDVRIATLRLDHVPVAFADLPPFALFGLKDQPALLLGNDVLELFRRVALDFGRRRVRFVLR